MWRRARSRNSWMSERKGVSVPGLAAGRGLMLSTGRGFLWDFLLIVPPCCGTVGAWGRNLGEARGSFEERPAGEDRPRGLPFPAHRSRVPALRVVLPGAPGDGTAAGRGRAWILRNGRFKNRAAVRDAADHRRHSCNPQIRKMTEGNPTVEGPGGLRGRLSSPPAGPVEPDSIPVRTGSFAVVGDLQPTSSFEVWRESNPKERR